MFGFLILGLGSFLTGAAVAVVQQRRSRVDDEYGEDPNWPAVPYTSEAHPSSPQAAATTPSPPTPDAGQKPAEG